MAAEQGLRGAVCCRIWQKRCRAVSACSCVSDRTTQAFLLCSSILAPFPFHDWGLIHQCFVENWSQLACPQTHEGIVHTVTVISPPPPSHTDRCTDGLSPSPAQTHRHIPHLHMCFEALPSLLFTVNVCSPRSQTSHFKSSQRLFLLDHKWVMQRLRNLWTQSWLGNKGPQVSTFPFINWEVEDPYEKVRNC